MILLASESTLLLTSWRTVGEVKMKTRSDFFMMQMQKQGRKAAYGENGSICLVCDEYEQI